MNKKDYEKIAEIIRHCKDEHNLVPYKTYVDHLVDYFEKEYPQDKVSMFSAGLPISDKFDKQQFRKACGVEE